MYLMREQRDEERSNQTVAGLKLRVEIEDFLGDLRSNQTVAGLKLKEMAASTAESIEFKSDRCGIETCILAFYPPLCDVQIRPLRD